MAKRGELTPTIAQKMEKFLGREATQKELRLYPYLAHVMVNDRKIEPIRIDQPEREILSKLRAEGHIEGGASGLAMTREFFLFISDVVFDAYAAFDNFPEAATAVPAQ